MKKINEIAKGKAKSMFSTENEDHLIMHFSDDTSAFDGKKREALLGKGAVNNQFNAFIMNHLKDNGVESHLIEVIDSTDSLVYKLDMFPIECVIRNRASGSICKRLGTEDGLVLENPLFEVFLKDDEGSIFSSQVHFKNPLIDCISEFQILLSILVLTSSSRELKYLSKF